MKYFSTKRGYTLLFAVLTAALVLGVAVFILSISRKQFILSVTARDSMYSLYAADSGVECVTMQLPFDSIDAGATVAMPCNGMSPQAQGTFAAMTQAEQTRLGFSSSNNPVQTSEMVLTLPQAGCAKVKISEGYDSIDPTSFKTVIESSGYNISTVISGVVTCPVIGPRTLERSIKVVIK